MEQTCLERLEALGLTHAAKVIKEEIPIRQKLSVAYEHYRYVTQKKLDQFRQQLEQATKVVINTDRPGGLYTPGTNGQETYRFTTLHCTPLEDYESVPPTHVLDAIEEAQRYQCFARYEVLRLKEETIKPDPILFGVVAGSSDRFFIAQWDHDVAIEDILKDHEGWAFLDKEHDHE